MRHFHLFLLVVGALSLAAEGVAAAALFWGRGLSSPHTGSLRRSSVRGRASRGARQPGSPVV